MSQAQFTVETLPERTAEAIGSIPREERLAPTPDVDTDAIDDLSDLAKELHGRPRSERVQIAFGWRPTDYQAKVLDYPEHVDRAQCAPQKGRQVGATELAGKIGADYALMNARTDILYAAPGQDTADEMFAEFKDSFKHGLLSLDEFGVTKNNEQSWEFDNGIRALSRTLGAVGQEKNSGNRGMNPTCVIIDEAHYEQDRVYTEEIEEFFITHPTYEYYLFSTPAGQSGYFYEKVDDGLRDYSEAIDTEWSWYAPYWPTKISPFAQVDYIEKKREEFDSSTFAQEFKGEFAADGDSAIPHSTLVPNLDPSPNRSPKVPRYLGIDPARHGDDECVIFDITKEGKWWNVWAYESISGPQLIEVLEALHNGKTEFEHLEEYPTPVAGQGTTPNDGYRSILIEENGIGGYAADFAQAGLGGAIKVVTSTNETKQNIYQRFIKDLEDTALVLPKVDRFVRQTTKLKKKFTPTGKEKYEHPPGGHDDWPDAVAFANWARHGNGDQLQTTAATSVPLSW